MDKVQEKIQAIKDMVHSYKYDPDFEETKGSLEDLQIDWLIAQLKEAERIQISMEQKLVENGKRIMGLIEEKAILEDSLPTVLKVKGGKPTKIAYNGSEYTRVHPMTAKGVR
ncbi:hypothetical protein [Priestia megaterium]|uniref:hypothetical protein n=1 Tax=Priestia megaterium TaxID=1404 RepID=UPI000CA097E4|nr:hypothetical protein [Priestia megaterium]AUO14764.1 hypothetical protein C0569_26110 [Priestia megaterium]